MARFQRKEGIGVSVSTITSSHRTPPSESPSAFQVQSSGTTSPDKSSICGKDTPTQKSSKTSVPGSTSSAKDCGPYWNAQCEELSSRLWLPTETVLQGSEVRSSSLLFNSPVENSWFLTRFHSHPSKNSLLTCLPSFTSFPVDCTDSESTRFKSRKIRIYPNQTQRSLLRRWFGVSRYVYNRTVEYLKQPGTKANWMEIRFWLLKNLPDWCDEVPFQVKAEAVHDACKAVKNAKRRYRETKRISHVSFRCRKDAAQTIFIPKTAMHQTTGPYHTMLGEMRFSEVVPPPVAD